MSISDDYSAGSSDGFRHLIAHNKGKTKELLGRWTKPARNKFAGFKSVLPTTNAQTPTLAFRLSSIHLNLDAEDLSKIIAAIMAFQ
jgi:hypothetical protein